jgi:hypothetical protein
MSSTEIVETLETSEATPDPTLSERTTPPLTISSSPTLTHDAPNPSADEGCVWQGQEKISLWSRFCNPVNENDTQNSSRQIEQSGEPKQQSFRQRFEIGLQCFIRNSRPRREFVVRSRGCESYLMLEDR